MNADRINALSGLFHCTSYSVRHMSSQCEAIFDAEPRRPVPGVGVTCPALSITLTYDLPKGVAGRIQRLSLTPEEAKAYGEVMLGFAAVYGAE